MDFLYALICDVDDTHRMDACDVAICRLHNDDNTRLLCPSVVAGFKAFELYKNNSLIQFQQKSKIMYFEE